MKLNKESKDELRKSVEVLLNATPSNKKIQLPKETLDLLLFDTYICNREKGIKIKLPVWSGEFLQKLDLSQVDFEDVSWCLIAEVFGNKTQHFFEQDENNILDNEFKNQVKKISFSPVKSDYLVDYSNTNAKIDFSKSFDFKYYDYLQIFNCDFSNVNLSNNNFNNLGSVHCYRCSFRNTNIGMSKAFSIWMFKCDFSDNDLSNLKIDGV